MKETIQLAVRHRHVLRVCIPFADQLGPPVVAVRVLLVAGVQRIRTGGH